MTITFVNDKLVELFKRRIILITGIGFFTDAYDLFVIGIVTALLTSLWHLSTCQVALLNAASLAAAAIGAIIFGIVADQWGRKTFYGVEVMLLSLGAVFSAFSSHFVSLLIARLIIGLGIGGDYSTSAIIASEYGTTKRRGQLVLWVFSMQSLGLIIGPLFASLLLALPLEPDFIWRILLLAGAVPAIVVFFLRRRIKETPRFLLTQPARPGRGRFISQLSTRMMKIKNIRFERQSLFTKKWLRCLLGTSSAWFLFDIAFYGNTLSSMLILKTLNRSGSLLTETLLSTLIFTFFAAPGYYLAACYVDRLGRKFLQRLGFLMMGFIYLIIACLPSLPEHTTWFILIFGISYFFVNFGPNATTFLIPSEIYPANLRAKGHGISVAVGKLGAFIGAFLLPPLLSIYGIPCTFLLLALVSFLGILSTLLVPEMAQLSIDHVELVNKPTFSNVSSLST